MEKMLAAIISSISHNVFKRLVSSGVETKSLSALIHLFIATSKGPIPEGDVQGGLPYPINPNMAYPPQGLNSIPVLFLILSQ